MTDGNSDSTSGLNENRPGLKRLIRDARKEKFNVVAVTYEDRLARFGVTYLRELLSGNSVDLEVLYDSVKYSAEEELMSDFMALIASFSGRFYRLRSKASQRELLNKAGEALGD